MWYSVYWGTKLNRGKSVSNREKQEDLAKRGGGKFIGGTNEDHPRVALSKVLDFHGSSKGEEPSHVGRRRQQRVLKIVVKHKRKSGERGERNLCKGGNI